MGNKTVRAVDLFCGAGGTSNGLVNACARLGMRLDLTAVNHWDVAVQTHSANHPSAHHLQYDLDNLNPRSVVKGRLDLLTASPECIHHSVARGGKPVQDQSRATAWCVVRWAAALQPRLILVENVGEFRTWGPLGTNGKPLKRRRGEIYQAWLTALRSLGYAVEDRVLNCADYGDATARERLFVVATRGRGPVPWPEPTHSRDGMPTLFGHLPKWRPARDIIDWSLSGESIFNRKRPLSDNTLRRIEAGLNRFSCLPFTFHLTHPDANRDRLNDLDAPLPTVTGANRGEMGLVRPFLVPQFAEHGPRSPDRPLGVITTTSRGIGLAQPFLVRLNGGGCKGAGGVKGADEPIPSLVAQGTHLALCDPFVLPPEGIHRGNAPRTMDVPLQTITAGRGGGYVVHPFLVKYNGTALSCSVDEPLHAITTRDRYALILPDGNLLDILFRMLQPHELAAAHSFPVDYKFHGTKGDVVKQIGNSVPSRTAEALNFALLSSISG